MPPLPADFIHARACKLKCEKILTRPGQKARRLGMLTFFKQALGIKIQKCGGHPWRLE